MQCPFPRLPRAQSSSQASRSLPAGSRVRNRRTVIVAGALATAYPAAVLSQEERTITPVFAGVLIAWVAVFGVSAWRLARSRDRGPAVWLAFGAVLGPIALALLLAAPPGRCRSCLTPTQGWLTVCAWCHEDVRVIPVQTRELLAKMSPAPIPRERSGERNHARPIENGELNPRRVAASQPSGFGLPRVGGIVRRAADRSPAVDGRRMTGKAAATMTTTTRQAFEITDLATATYIAGNTTLEPGGRYLVSIDAARLRLLGPVDVNPSVVALDFDIADMDASVTGGRLLISQHRDRSGAVLAFMGVAGMTPDGLASAIVQAAKDSHR